MGIIDKQVYRTPFIVYTLSLFLACILVCAVLFQMILNSQVERVTQETLHAFEDAQRNIAQNIEKIDNYFLRLYSEQNLPILQDFLRFFGNDAETYMTRRLEEILPGSTRNDFIEDMKNFVSSNQHVISQISFITLKNSNIIYYKDNGNSQVKFRVPNQMNGDNNIALGYSYTKKIMQPDNMTVTLGEVNFMIRADRIFDMFIRDYIGYVAVMSKDGELFFDGDEEIRRQLRRIYDNGINSSNSELSYFNKQYYTVYTSEQYGYKMISLVTRREIIQKNSTVFMFIIFGMLFIFISITSLIATRMSYDARYLSRILQAIDQARSGRFIKIDVEKRKDEYSIIARKINDMSEQLDEHIHKEYIVKLKQKEAEMKIMQQQINPHFLYNTLEIIRCRAQMNNDEDVADAVYNLGGIFREVVKGEDVITIGKELEILTKYLKIMEFKFHGKFYYQIDVEPDVCTMKTVKFWMQPLVENFFTHGFDKASDFNLVLIRGRRDQQGVVFEIVNNGKKIGWDNLERINRGLSGKEQETFGESGIGIHNVYTRLCFFYGEGLKMNVRNNMEAGITVSVFISKEEGHVPVADCG